MKAIRRPVRQLALFWRVAPWHTAAMVPILLLGPVLLVATMVTSGRLVDGVVAGRDARELVWLAIVLCGAFIGQGLLGGLRAVVVAGMTERVIAEIDGLVADTALAPHGVGHLEQDEVAAPLRGVNDDLHSLFATVGCEGTWQVYATRLRASGAFLVVAVWNPVVAVLLTLAQMASAQSFNRYISKLAGTIFGESAGDKARELWFRNLTTRRDAAKEVRLFGLVDWALGRSDELWRAFSRDEWRRRDAGVRGTLAWQVSLLAATAVALGLLGRDLWSGVVSAGTGVALLTGVQSLGLFGNLGDWQTFAVRHQSMIDELDQLRRDLGLPGVLARRRALPAGSAGEGRAAAIDLTGVSFTYPTRRDPIFTGLDLHVPAGQSCAVVGVNGAGKSTLIKLLTGLYPPEAGTVRVDGGDPAADDDVRRRVAVIFQDFTRYPDDLVENVVLALPAAAAERGAAATRALERANATAVLERVGSLDAPLSAEFEGGTDLSGGQWQRVALARALAAVDQGAGVLVLDEPTAALDVRAEAELFDRFLAVTRGVTTILVSHRLSSVRRAERIVVIDEGRIVEDGSHEELLARNGRYADAFRLQASRFAAAGAGGGDDDE